MTLKFKCRTPSLLQDSASRERSTVLTAESGLIADHQMAIARQTFHEPFDDMASQHMVEGRAPAGADEHGVDVESLGRIGDGLGGIVRNGPDRDGFDAFAAHLLQGGT